MNVAKWSLWHTYSSFFGEEFFDLSSVSLGLVSSGVAEFAYGTNGTAHWRHGESVESGPVDIQFRRSEKAAEITFPPSLRGFGLECAYQAGAMRVQERYMINESKLLEAPFVRAFLGVCHLKTSGGQVNLYPQIKLYANGVFLLHFRLFSPEGGTPLDQLVDRYENVFLLRAESIEMAPSLLLAAESNILLAPGMPRIERDSVLAHLDRRQHAIRESAVEASDGDFVFKVASLTPDESLSPGESHDFDTLRAYVTAAVEWSVTRNRDLPRGNPERRRTHRVGGFWSCRPTVYLIDFEGQPSVAEAGSPEVREAATAVLTRIGTAGRELADKYVGPDLRASGDYSLFMNDAVSLIVFSKTGAIHGNEGFEPNYGHIVYEKLAVAEAIDYQRLSHVRLLELSSTPKVSLSVCLEERGELDRVQNWLRPSNFGEVNEILSHAQEIFGLSAMRERIRGNSVVGKEDYLAGRNTSIATLALTITIVLGAASAPTIASAFFVPPLKSLHVLSSQPAASTLVVVYLATFLLTLLGAWAIARCWQRRW